MRFKGLAITTLEKRQALICIMISLLMYGLTWCGLSPNVGEPNQANMLIFDSFKESPLQGKESYPAPPPLWQANQSSIAFLQNVTVIRSNKVFYESSGNAKSAPYYRHQSAESTHTVISFRIANDSNTASKLRSDQIYQTSDISPPYVLVSL